MIVCAVSLKTESDRVPPKPKRGDLDTWRQVRKRRVTRGGTQLSQSCTGLQDENRRAIPEPPRLRQHAPDVFRPALTWRFWWRSGTLGIRADRRKYRQLSGVGRASRSALSRVFHPAIRGV